MTRTRDDHDYDSFVQIGEKSYRRVLSNDFLFEVAKGNIEGHSFVEKFGENPEVTTQTDPEDVWSFGGLYTFSTIADIDTVSSSNASDTNTVLITGLDSSWNEVHQEVTLNGQSKVTLTTPLIRVYRAYNNNGVEFEGTIYIYVNDTISGGVPDNDENVRAIIKPLAQQTEMCIYTVPDGHTAFFIKGYVSISRPNNAVANFVWLARLFGGVFRVQSRIAVSTEGGSSWQYQYPIPLALPGKTDVKIRCEEVSATVGVSGGFTVLLIDNNYL